MRRYHNTSFWPSLLERLGLFTQSHVDHVVERRVAHSHHAIAADAQLAAYQQIDDLLEPHNLTILPCNANGVKIGPRPIYDIDYALKPIDGLTGDRVVSK